MHPAYASHHHPEDPKARHKPSQKDGLTSVTGKEPLRSRKPLGGYKCVAAPSENERAASFSAHPIAYLVSNYGTENTEYDGIP
jgi:hypothetical protein